MDSVQRWSSSGTPAGSLEELAALYAALGEGVLAQTSTEGVLAAITSVAVASIPTVSYASITRLRASGYQTVGATDPLAKNNDELQYVLNNGPCVEAVRGEAATVSVPELATDQRFIPFASVATEVSSMLSLPASPVPMRGMVPARSVSPVDMKQEGPGTATATATAAAAGAVSSPRLMQVAAAWS